VSIITGAPSSSRMPPSRPGASADEQGRAFHCDGYHEKSDFGVPPVNSFTGAETALRQSPRTSDGWSALGRMEKEHE
jgi:hypothetical protein